MSSVVDLPRAKILGAGRPTKFTPERIEQIRNLVERGKYLEEIAGLIGVTVGSLKVTCSRSGISLRRPVVKNGCGLLPQKDPPRNAPPPRPQLNGTTNGGDNSPPNGNDDAMLLSLVFKMQHKGRQRSIELPLIQDTLGQLALEAEFRDMKIGDLVNEILKKVLNRNLLEVVLEQQP